MDAKDAVMLEFEVKARQDKVENDCRDPLVMLVPDNGGREHWIGYEAPSAVWSRRRVILPEGIIGKTRKMKIGCCPSGNEISFLLRNVKLRTRKSK